MILVFGGTSDSLIIMTELNEAGAPCILSVATDYGVIVSKAFASQVVNQRLDQKDMEAFIDKKGIKVILDASHPFADLVSKNAINAAKAKRIPYVRYERPALPQADYVTLVHSISEFCEIEKDKEGIIYLSTGSKSVGDFVDQLGAKRLIARVLPTSSVLKKCESVGLDAGKIHAIKPPFSYELNQDLFLKVNAKVLVTKESGQTGGVDVKIKAAHDLGMRTYVIGRPEIDYPELYHDPILTRKAVIKYLEGE